MQTEKRIHVSLNEKSLKELKELEKSLKESQSAIVRHSIAYYHHNILINKDDTKNA